MVVMGPDELAAGQVKARNMQTHEEASGRSRGGEVAARLLWRRGPTAPKAPSIDEVFGRISEGN